MHRKKLMSVLRLGLTGNKSGFVGNGSVAAMCRVWAK